MKYSGVEWVGEIPKTWDVKKLKHLFDVFNGSTPKSTEKSYWDGDISWITPADMSDSKIISNGSRCITKEGFESSNLTLADPGDIVISCRAPIGSINIVSKPLCTNQGCKLLKPHSNVDTSYFYYYLSVQKEILNSFGSGTTFMELSTTSLRDFIVPCPDVNSQKTISLHLDKECSKIDESIDNQKSIIAKLKELKQSMISNVVTKGLNINVKVIDSGVPWIGTIPDNWAVDKIKNHVIISTTKIESYDQYLALENVESWSGVFVPTDSPVSDNQSIQISKGDLCFSKLRPYLAKAIIAPFDGACSSEFIVIRKYSGDLRYLKYLMLSSLFIQEVSSSTYGTKMPRANWDYIGSISIPLPPIDEQTEIATYLDNECLRIDELITLCANSIIKLDSFKESLIHEYVTGKKTVKEVC